MAEIFISFIHEEEPFSKLVSDYAKIILGNSIESFMSSDGNAIYAGENWMTRIFEELKTTKVLISMLTPVSVLRPWINFEAGAAIAREAKIVPVCFGGLTIAALPKPYSSWQAVEINTTEGAYYLFSSIAHHLGIKQPEKPLFSEGLPHWTDSEKQSNELLLGPYKHLVEMIRIISRLKNLVV